MIAVIEKKAERKGALSHRFQPLRLLNQNPREGFGVKSLIVSKLLYTSLYCHSLVYA